jgi:hypothetical protein
VTSTPGWRGSSKKKETGTSRTRAIGCSRLALTRFVLLHVLEGQGDSFSELGLAHRQYLAAHANAVADVLVREIQRLREVSA